MTEITIIAKVADNWCYENTYTICPYFVCKTEFMEGTRAYCGLFLKYINEKFNYATSPPLNRPNFCRSSLKKSLKKITKNKLSKYEFIRSR